MEDKFARQNNEALRDIAFEKLETVIKQLHQFARVRERGAVGEFARGVEGYASLGGVRDYEPHCRLFGQFQVGVEIGIRVHAAAHNINQINAIDLFTAVKSLKVKVIKAVLLVQHPHLAARPWLHHNHRRVEIGQLVSLPNNPIRESAQKIALAKLNHLFGVGFGLDCLSIKLLHFVSR